MIIETIEIQEQFKDMAPCLLQDYLYSLAMFLYENPNNIDDYKYFVPVYNEDKWLIYFGTKEEVKLYDKDEFIYQMKYFCDVKNVEKYKDSIWENVIDYIQDWNCFLANEECDIEKD